MYIENKVIDHNKYKNLNYEYPPINIDIINNFEIKNSLLIPEDFKYYISNISSCIYPGHEINLRKFINRPFPYRNNFDYDKDTKSNHSNLGKCCICFNGNHELKKYLDIDTICFDCKGILIDTLYELKIKKIIYDNICLDELFCKYYFDYGPNIFNGILKLYESKYEVICIVINGQKKGEIWQYFLNGEIFIQKIADNLFDFLESIK